MSEASHVEGLIPCEQSTLLWVYFFSQISYHYNENHSIAKA